MRERDDIADLLAAAREALLAEVLPYLPPDRRYPALMAANALAIAGRAVLAGMAEQPDDAALCRHIRAGQLDPGSPGHAAAVAALVAAARARCEVSNPRALRGR